MLCLAAGKRLYSVGWVLVVIGIACLYLSVLLSFLLLQHFCYLIKQLLHVVPTFGRNAVVGHLVLIYQLL